MSTTVKGHIKTWAQLLRLPNLFTVPGDALAGHALAVNGGLQPQGAASALVVLGLYIGGLLLNDFFDLAEDRRDRPDRPLPSGGASPTVVLAAGLSLLVLAPVLAFFFCSRQSGIAALIVTLLIIAYNMYAKQNRILGPIFMGLCRGGAVLVGALSVTRLHQLDLLVWLAILLSTVYIAAIAVVAADETKPTPPGGRALIPGTLLLFSGLLILVAGIYQENRFWPAALVFAIAAIDVLRSARRAMQNQLPCPAFIGRSIRAMLLIQAAWVLVAVNRQSWQRIITVLVIFAGARILADVSSRKFYGS